MGEVADWLNGVTMCERCGVPHAGECQADWAARQPGASVRDENGDWNYASYHSPDQAQAINDALTAYEVEKPCCCLAPEVNDGLDFHRKPGEHGQPA